MWLMETGQRKLSPNLFLPTDVGADAGERMAGPPVGFWKDSWSRL
jgi:hypothetical protein